MPRRGGRALVAQVQVVNARKAAEEAAAAAGREAPPQIMPPPLMLEKTRPAVPDPPRAPTPPLLLVPNSETEDAEPVRQPRPPQDPAEAEKGELHQAPATGSGDSQAALSYETNMAAFEAQDPSRRNPTRSNMGYAAVKASFGR